MTAGTRRWIPPLVGVLTFIVVAVAGGVVVTDWQIRGAEMRALTEAVEASEAAMISTQDGVQAVFDDYEGRQQLSPEDVARIDERLTRVAQEGLVGVTQAGVLVSAVPVLPWHSQIDEARQAYLAHNRAWQAYLSAAAADPAQFASPQPEVTRTFEEAEGPLRSAVPQPDVWQLSARVDAIYAEDGDAGGPGKDV